MSRGLVEMARSRVGSACACLYWALVYHMQIRQDVELSLQEAYDIRSERYRTRTSCFSSVKKITGRQRVNLGVVYSWEARARTARGIAEMIAEMYFRHLPGSSNFTESYAGVNGQTSPASTGTWMGIKCQRVHGIFKENGQEQLFGQVLKLERR